MERFGGTYKEYRRACQIALDHVHPSASEHNGYHLHERLAGERATFAVEPTAVVRCGHCKAPRPMVGVVLPTGVGPVLLGVPHVDMVFLLEWDFTDDIEAGRLAWVVDGLRLPCRRHADLKIPRHDELVAAAGEDGTGVVLAYSWTQTVDGGITAV